MGVDLSLLESLTRELLEAEAHRRGIKSPEFRTRGELIRLILRHQYGGQLEVSREALSRSIQTVRFVRAILGSALSALPELELLARLRREPEEPSTEPGAESPRVQEPERTHASAFEPAQQVVRDGLAQPHAEQLEGTERSEHTSSFDPGEDWERPTEEAIPALEPEPTATEAQAATQPVQPEPAVTAAQVALERAPTRVPDPPARMQPAASDPAPTREAVTRTFELEPIRTRSMARLLAAQGHRERALAIYEELLARGEVELGDDASLAAELSALRSGAQVPHADLPKPPVRSTPASLPEQHEHLVCEGEPERGLTLRWEISDAGTARARAVLGAREGEGELTVRLLAIHPDPDPVKVVRSEITEHGPVSAAGEWSLGPLRHAARCIAAIGLRAGDRFVSIVHAQPTG